MRKQQYKDITGKKFNKLSIIKYEYTKDKRAYWLCKCDCGNELSVMGKNLRLGLTKSCGCIISDTFRKKYDLTGKKFAFLKVIKYIGLNSCKTAEYECECDCGNNAIISGTKLKSGHTKSCGCLHKKGAKERAILRNKKMKGESHPKWRHDLTEEDRFNARHRELNPKLWRWRIKVLKKYHYTCQKCKIKSVSNLVCHHIYAWEAYAKLRFVTNNGIVFCEECHKEFHGKYGYGKNTRKQLTDFLKFP